MSFLTNLILFSPLLLVGFVILYVLDRAESLRKGAGLVVAEAEAETEKEAEGEAEALLPNVAADSTPEERGGFGSGDGGDGGVGSDQPAAKGEADEVGRAETRSPISGDDGFQLVRGEESEDLDVEEEEQDEDEGEEEDEFEIVDRGRDDDDDPPGAAGPSGSGSGAGGGGNAGGQQQLPPPPPPPPPPPRRIPKTKTVGAKKAASLARRDQRRAYNEFHRSRALAAAEEARLEEEARAEEVFAERQRRAVAEEEIVARREKERIARQEREKEIEKAAKEDLGRLRSLVTASGEGNGGRKAWKIEGLAGEIGRNGKWVLEGLEKEGLLGVKERVSEGAAVGDDAGGREWEMRMVTGKGYYVVVREADARALFEKLDESGEKGMSWAEMGRRLEEVLALE
ncbi:hypothetical protein L211DRAFT_845241 [Terfezia boudieri ATCC MYA-4762]|uniref:Uncharacterized protein n=1 Tax=Terfezia boudieri ATCC MYA-4762 TaxID=1051890 RepID=A0A3N4M9J6_9PEZI|nr:hypothetical protein L211DRAFT_845241 [Terfezia boudieri ATCC MYA-4762]